MPIFSSATEIDGRITAGGYAASETFSDSSAGSDKNDFLTTSARFYLRASEMGERKNWHFTSDVRDKHDFFDKLDRERLQLGSANRVQLRELNLRFDAPSKSAYGVGGRFPVPEAGSVYCDGGLAGLKPRPTWTVATFGGLNARRNDQQYVTYNPNNYNYGAFLQYQSQGRGWDRNLYSSLAFVQQTQGAEVDRSYLFTNTSYQWSARSRVVNLLYLDFVPRTYIQTAFFDWQQRLSSSWTSRLTALGVDVIEYTRRQGIRERLEPSPYKEARAGLTKEFSSRMRITGDYAYGYRDSDKMNKKDYRLLFHFPRLISPQWDLSARAGYRDNFTSTDLYARFGLGYFRRNWELTFDAEYGVEKYEGGETLHPIILEVSSGFYISQRTLAALAVDYAQDERVKIASAFVKVSYRFGSQEVAPTRDGASPRGRL